MLDPLLPFTVEHLQSLLVECESADEKEPIRLREAILA
jgi:hypothetical protein